MTHWAMVKEIVEPADGIPRRLWRVVLAELHPIGRPAMRRR